MKYLRIASTRMMNDKYMSRLKVRSSHCPIKKPFKASHFLVTLRYNPSGPHWSQLIWWSSSSWSLLTSNMRLPFAMTQSKRQPTPPRHSTLTQRHMKTIIALILTVLLNAMNVAKSLKCLHQGLEVHF